MRGTSSPLTCQAGFYSTLTDEQKPCSSDDVNHYDPIYCIWKVHLSEYQFDGQTYPSWGWLVWDSPLREVIGLL